MDKEEEWLLGADLDGQHSGKYFSRHRRVWAAGPFTWQREERRTGRLNGALQGLGDPGQCRSVLSHRIHKLLLRVHPQQNLRTVLNTSTISHRSVLSLRRTQHITGVCVCVCADPIIDNILVSLLPQCLLPQL